MYASSRKLHKRSFALRLTPGLVDQCPDRINPPLPLPLSLLGWPWSTFLLQPRLPLSSSPFLTDPPLSPNRPSTSSSHLFIECKVIPPSVSLTPHPSVSSDSFHPSENPTSTPPASLYPRSHQPPLSDPCQSKPWGSPGTTSRGNPLKDVGGGGRKVSSGIKAKKQYRVIPLLKSTPYFTPPHLHVLGLSHLIPV